MPISWKSRRTILPLVETAVLVSSGLWALNSATYLSVPQTQSALQWAQAAGAQVLLRPEQGAASALQEVQVPALQGAQTQVVPVALA